MHEYYSFLGEKIDSTSFVSSTTEVDYLKLLQKRKQKSEFIFPKRCIKFIFFNNNWEFT